MKTLFLFSLFMAALCTVGSLVAADELLMHPFSDPHGFTISFPRKWSVRPRYHQTEVSAKAKADMADNNSFIPNANVMMANLRGMSLDQFHDASMKKIEASVANYQLEDSGTTKINGHDAHWAMFQATIRGVSGKMIQYMIRNGKEVVIVTGIDSIDQFSKDRPTLEAIATSVNFEKESINHSYYERSSSGQPSQSMSLSRPTGHKPIFQIAPGDAYMPARLYYER